MNSNKDVQHNHFLIIFSSAEASTEILSMPVTLKHFFNQFTLSDNVTKMQGAYWK